MPVFKRDNLSFKDGYFFLRRYFMFQKTKDFLINQIIFIIILLILVLLYFLLNIKIINLILIPLVISFFTYNILITKTEKEKANKLIYPITFLIFIFYLESYFLGLPKFDFLPFPFNNFLIYYLAFIFFIQYIKSKKHEYYKFFIYISLATLFIIPILNNLIKIITK